MSHKLYIDLLKAQMVWVRFAKLVLAFNRQQITNAKGTFVSPLYKFAWL